MSALIADFHSGATLFPSDCRMQVALYCVQTTSTLRALSALPLFGKADAARFILSNLSLRSSNSLSWILNAEMEFRVLMGRDRKLEIPTLVQLATNDLLVDNSATFDYAMRHIRDPVIRVYTDALHNLWQERDGIRNRVLEETTQFFDAHS